MPKMISIALATYNGAAFLKEQLASIARQTLPPAELVVTDDNSSDDTVAILEHFARTAPFPVNIQRNADQLGYRANFMKAVSLCQADLIALCDQDDVWDASKLLIASAAFEEPDVTLFFHNAWLIDQSGHQIGPADIYSLPSRNAPLSVDSMVNPSGLTIVFDRRLLQLSDLWQRSIDSNDPQSPMGHDQWLFFLASIFGTIVYSDARLVNYRQHQANVFGFKRSKGLAARVERLRYRFTNHAKQYGLLSHVADVRADILKECQSRVEGIWQQRAAAGEQANKQLADWLAQRERLYGDAKPWERIGIVRSLQKSGAYAGGGIYNIGRSALAKDMALGMILRRFLVHSHSSNMG